MNHEDEEAASQAKPEGAGPEDGSVPAEG